MIAAAQVVRVGMMLVRAVMAIAAVRVVHQVVVQVVTAKVVVQVVQLQAFHQQVAHLVTAIPVVSVIVMIAAALAVHVVMIRAVSVIVMIVTIVRHVRVAHQEMRRLLRITSRGRNFHARFATNFALCRMV